MDLFVLEWVVGSIKRQTRVVIHFIHTHARRHGGLKITLKIHLIQFSRYIDIKVIYLIYNLIFTSALFYLQPRVFSAILFYIWFISIYQFFCCFFYYILPFAFFLLQLFSFHIHTSSFIQSINHQNIWHSFKFVAQSFNNTL